MAFPTGWQRRCEFTVESTMVSSGTLTDFPVLLTVDCLPAEFYSSSDGNRPQADGGDIRAAQNSDGSGQLPLEIVHYTQGGSPKVEIWVKLPSIGSAGDTAFWVFWKGGGSESQPATGDTYGRNAVWSAYVGVWHGGSLTNSQGNTALNMTASGTTSVTTSGGPWGGDSRDFNGTTGRLDVDAAAFSAFPFSMSGWGKPDNTTANAVVLGVTDKDNATPRHLLFVAGAVDDLVWMQVNPSGQAEAKSTTTYSSGVWQLYAGAANSSSIKALINGAFKNTAAHALSIGAVDRTSIGVAGDSTPSGFFDGNLGECRIATTELDDAWFLAEYRNGDEPETYITDGTPEDTGFGGGGGTVIGAGLIRSLRLERLRLAA